MSFKEFDLTEYIEALEVFQKNSADVITKYWGSIENFDSFLKKLKEDETHVAQLAVQYFGSVETYTEAMKYNLEHFSEIMDSTITEDVKKIGTQSDALYARLTSDLSRDISSHEVQCIVREIENFVLENGGGFSVGTPFGAVISDAYSSDYVQRITDAKYGVGRLIIL